MSKRDEARTLLNAILPAGTEIQSKRDEKKFKELTGVSHKDLVDNWRGGGIMTACNGFVDWYATELKIQPAKREERIASWFKLQESLRSTGRVHAWVTADGRSEPQYGDILHHYKAGTGLHVDVCIGFTKEDHKLIRAGAGQGGPGKGFDVLTRVEGTAAYNYHNLIGWLDIEQFFWSPPVTSAEPTGNWVVGWWKVYDGNQYYYYFDVDGRVQYTEKPPATQYMPPKVPLNSGQYTYEPNRRVVIEWNPADGGQTIETFSAKVDLTTMNGTSNRYAPLYANRYTAKR